MIYNKTKCFNQQTWSLFDIKAFSMKDQDLKLASEKLTGKLSFNQKYVAL